MLAVICSEYLFIFIYFLAFIYGFGIWYLMQRWNHTLRAFENMALIKIFVPNREEVKKYWREVHTEALYNLYYRLTKRSPVHGGLNGWLIERWEMLLKLWVRKSEIKSECVRLNHRRMLKHTLDKHGGRVWSKLDLSGSR